MAEQWNADRSTLAAEAPPALTHAVPAGSPGLAR